MSYKQKEINLIWKIIIDSDIQSLDERRNFLRKKIIEYFFNEKPWTWSWELASRHLYFVEEFITWNKLCLKRPANLKNWFDFLIFIPDSNINSEWKYKDAPSFNNVLDLIKNECKNTEFKKSFKINIEKIYNCFEISNFYNEQEEVLLKICKWFFIEQDIRYWHYSWRNKFYNEILHIC